MQTLGCRHMKRINGLKNLKLMGVVEQDGFALKYITDLETVNHILHTVKDKS